VPTVKKPTSLNFLEHLGPVKACTGIPLPLPFTEKIRVFKTKHSYNNISFFDQYLPFMRYCRDVMNFLNNCFAKYESSVTFKGRTEKEFEFWETTANITDQKLPVSSVLSAALQRNTG
jgi:hypothetical protein